MKIIAPEGFMEHAVSENVIAGPAMTRRARFQFGSTLPRGPEGEMTSGLGPGISTGTISLIAPTDIISKTGQEMTIDGVTLSFQVTPGTEAPAEMNFYLPQMRAVFMAENANATMHNLLPARGALVRDAKAWADYLTRVDPALRRQERRDVRGARHSALRQRRDQGLSGEASRRVQISARSDRAADECRPDRQRDRRAVAVAGRAGARMVQSRLLRHDEPQFEGGLSALHGLVRRQPGVAECAAAGGGGDALCRGDGRRGRGDREGAMRRSKAGEYRWAAMLLNHVVFADAGRTRRHARSWPTSTRSSAIAPKPARGATSI